MEGGLVSPSVEGTPQGGPLSPLLSNLVLNELDRELERRGHRYARYARWCGRLCQEDAEASCCTKDEGRPFGATL